MVQDELQQCHPNVLLFCTLLKYSKDAEEDGNDEEDPPCEGRCDVHNAAADTLLSAALCPPGEDGINHSTEFK